MSKNKARARRKSSTSKVRRNRGRRSTIIIALILCLGLSSLILARWGGFRPSFNAPPVPTPTPSLQLSKEYIYAGGRLIATEEPGNGGSALIAPTNFSAHADATTQVTLSWASTSASGYLVERSTNYDASNNGFTQLTTVDCTGGCAGTISYQDNLPSGNATTYLYRVRSTSGAQQSSPSVMDFATTKAFADQISNQNPPGKTTIKANHFLELRDAVNAVRHAAGLGDFAWSDSQGRVPASGAPILRSHLQDLREALDQALGHMGFTLQAYSNPGVPVGTPVKKEHIDELRQRTKGISPQ